MWVRDARSNTDGTLRNRLLILLATVGCAGDELPAVSVEPEPAPSAAARVDPVVKGVPHGAPIVELAVTEAGDAALTFDNIGGVRLWPALDGSRTPVPVSVVAPRQLALSHAGADVLAGVLDEAGAVDLLRLGRDGTVRGRVQLPAEVAYEQVVALDDGMLVRSADQSIEWVSADGESRGKVIAEPTRRIQTIAARNGVAIAITSDGTRHQLRWLLTLGGTLMWGTSFELPVTVRADDVALSPSHGRIAIIDTSSHLSVFDIGLVPTRIGATRFISGGDIDLGFVGDDRVALASTQVQWWTAPAEPQQAKDPWAVDTSFVLATPLGQATSAGAIADGLAVTATGSSLALLDGNRTRYLGYQQQGTGRLTAAPGSLAMAPTASRVLWFDDRLALQRDIELRSQPSASWLFATPIGDHHVVTQSQAGGKYVVKLVDVDKPDQPVELGTYSSVHRIELSPESNLLGVADDRKLYRFKLDLATNTVTSLPTLRVRGAPGSLRLLDPARADGIAAITVGWDGNYDDYPTLTVHRENGTKKRVRPFKGSLLDIAPDGTTYTHDGAHIIIRRGDKQVDRIPAKGFTHPMAVSRDGSRFAVRDGIDVVVLDRAGRETWRKPVWGVGQIVFTADGKHLAAVVSGGLVLLAAETGEREAMECGWSFGLTETAPVANTIAAAPVCEDPML